MHHGASSSCSQYQPLDRQCSWPSGSSPRHCPRCNHTISESVDFCLPGYTPSLCTARPRGGLESRAPVDLEEPPWFPRAGLPRQLYHASDLCDGRSARPLGFTQQRRAMMVACNFVLGVHHVSGALSWRMRTGEVQLSHVVGVDGLLLGRGRRIGGGLSGSV